MEKGNEKEDEWKIKVKEKGNEWYKKYKKYYMERKEEEKERKWEKWSVLWRKGYRKLEMRKRKIGENGKDWRKGKDEKVRWIY